MRRNLWDLLHVAYLGFVKDVVGQVLYDFASARSPDDLKLGLQLEFLEFKTYWKDNKISVGNKLWV